MNDREILNRLWEACRETPFASFTLERKLNLTKSEYRDVLNLIGDMADSGEVRSGYRIKRVASTMLNSFCRDREIAIRLRVCHSHKEIAIP